MEKYINKIINADCMDILKQLPDKSIDAIICDLPYGVLNTNNAETKWDIVIPFDKLWEQYERIIKDNGAILLFSKQPFTSDLVNSNRKLFRYELIWEKSRAGNSMQVCNQPSAIHENIEVFYKKQPCYNDIKFKVDEKYIDKRKSIRDSYYSSGHHKGSVMKRKPDDGYRHAQSILPFNSVWEKGMHPTQKPVELFEFLIKSYSQENDLILDNCSGSGSLAIAAYNTHRNFICIEKDYDYWKASVERLENAQAQLRLF